MHECLKVSEVGQIECQTCEKKIYVVKKILGKIFQKFFSLNLILLYILNYFHHFQPLLYYKKCAYLREVIRRDFDQCDIVLKNKTCSIQKFCQKLQKQSMLAVMKNNWQLFILSVTENFVVVTFVAAAALHL